MERRFGVPFPFTASMPKSSIEKVEGEKRLPFTCLRTEQQRCPAVPWGSSARSADPPPVAKTLKKKKKKPRYRSEKLKAFPLLSKLKLSQVMHFFPFYFFFNFIFLADLSHSSVSWSNSMSWGHPKGADPHAIAPPVASLAWWACIWKLLGRARSRDSLSLCQAVLFSSLPASPAVIWSLQTRIVLLILCWRWRLWRLDLICQAPEFNSERLYMVSQGFWSTWRDGTHALIEGSSHWKLSS